MAPLRWRRAVGAALSLAVLTTGSAAHSADRGLEYAVKANFLYKFAPFINWPPQAQPRGGRPFQICILGSDPFGAVLDGAVSGQRIGDAPIAVRRLTKSDGASGCQVLFLGSSPPQPAGDIARALRGQPVLTVSDDQPSTSGVAIRFVLRGGRVRFVIDRAAAGQAGLTISSKLLDLAVAVEN